MCISAEKKIPFLLCQTTCLPQRNNATLTYKATLWEAQGHDLTFKECVTVLGDIENNIDRTTTLCVMKDLLLNCSFEIFFSWFVGILEQCGGDIDQLIVVLLALFLCTRVWMESYFA